MLLALATGLLMGLSAGLAPGPMLALVLSQTLRHGAREGCKVALTPLVTDTPVIVASLVFASRLASLNPVLGLVSIAGGFFVLYLAWDTLRPLPLDSGPRMGIPKSWSKGILTNLLNPHPWLFWLTVGAAILANAITQGWFVAVAFLAGFYLLLVGSKMLVAIGIAHSRDWLAGQPYRWVLRALAATLTVFACLLLRDGWKRLLPG
jgi:threonine/homoserine/homoserine lactone efflux protein